MKAYKFRSEDQLHYTFDIILSNRLYCADWRKLNDPLEGSFSYNIMHAPEDVYQRIQRILEEKRKYKVCSLAGTYNNYLFWTHYASGFSGLAIEIELPEDSEVIKKVEYRSMIDYAQEHDLGDTSAIAERILSSKYNAYQYEEEIRIVQEDEWYTLDVPIQKIIIGKRMKKSTKMALELICQKKEIQMCRIAIKDEGLDLEYVAME